MSAVSTHVLDTAAGRPAAGVPVRLELVEPGGPTEIGRAVTDDDGRVGELGPARLEPGSYRLVFGTGRYLDGQADDGRRGPAFYPEVVVVFTADGHTAHYHLPLLLSPFGYTTYRGELTMAIVLGPNQYGKAETRLVRIRREGSRHEIRDLNVSTSLRGDFGRAHLDGDQGSVLPTDSQKNTCYAYAQEHGVGEIEDYALVLARHFADDIEPVSGARVDVDEYRWERVRVGGSGAGGNGAGGTGAGGTEVGGTEHPHTFVRAGQEVRTAAVTVEGTGPGQRTWVVSGLKDLVVLKSTGSEFAGFLTDPYTTLAETHDRILATSLTARWRYQGSAHQNAAGAAEDAGWAAAYAQVRQILLEQFALVHSRALQQSLWEMGKAVLEAREDIAEIRLSAPNKHHYLVDLSPFGLANPGEVFHADDRPYGLIQCAVVRDGAEAAGPAWESPAAFA